MITSVIDTADFRNGILPVVNYRTEKHEVFVSDLKFSFQFSKAFQNNLS